MKQNSLFRTLLVLMLMFMGSAMVQAQNPYAILSNDKATLTFFYDNEKSARNGMDIGPFSKKDERGWNEYREMITTVVFHESFAKMNSLKSTAHWFRGFENLKSILNLENLKTDNVIDMSYMFDDCKLLSKPSVNPVL